MQPIDLLTWFAGFRKTVGRNRVLEESSSAYASRVARTDGKIAMRVMLCLLIAIVAAPAWAVWVKSWESKTSGTITYFDPDTIRKDGDRRRVWVLQELKSRGKYGEMSRRALWEYNCREERFRALQLTFHTDPMASGSRLVSDNDPSDWHYIPPSTGGAVLLKLVCAK